MPPPLPRESPASFSSRALSAASPSLPGSAGGGRKRPLADDLDSLLSVERDSKRRKNLSVNPVLYRAGRPFPSPSTTPTSMTGPRAATTNDYSSPLNQPSVSRNVDGTGVSDPNSGVRHQVIVSGLKSSSPSPYLLSRNTRDKEKENDSPSSTLSTPSGSLSQTMDALIAKDSLRMGRVSVIQSSSSPAGFALPSPTPLLVRAPRRSSSDSNTFTPVSINKQSNNDKAVHVPVTPLSKVLNYADSSQEDRDGEGSNGYYNGTPTATTVAVSSNTSLTSRATTPNSSSSSSASASAMADIFQQLPLPPSLETVLKQANAVDTCYFLLRGHTSRIPFDKIKESVQKHTMKDFTVSDMGVLVALMKGRHWKFHYVLREVDAATLEVRERNAVSVQYELVVEYITGGNGAFSVSNRREQHRAAVVNYVWAKYTRWCAGEGILVDEQSQDFTWHKDFDLCEVLPPEPTLPGPQPQLNLMTPSKLTQLKGKAMDGVVQARFEEKCSQEGNRKTSDLVSPALKGIKSGLIDSIRSNFGVKEIRSEMVAENIRNRIIDKRIRVMDLIAHEMGKKGERSSLPKGDIMKMLTNRYQSSLATCPMGATEIKELFDSLIAAAPEWIQVKTISTGDIVKISKDQDVFKSVKARMMMELSQ
jgi:hypothetical protein